LETVAKEMGLANDIMFNDDGDDEGGESSER
jgi:hypothetical protein